MKLAIKISADIEKGVLSHREHRATNLFHASAGGKNVRMRRVIGPGGKVKYVYIPKSNALMRKKGTTPNVPHPIMRSLAIKSFGDRELKYEERAQKMAGDFNTFRYGQTVGQPMLGIMADRDAQQKLQKLQNQQPEISQMDRERSINSGDYEGINQNNTVESRTLDAEIPSQMRTHNSLMATLRREGAIP